MKVKELIEVLEKLDPEIELNTTSCCYGYSPVDGVTKGLDYSLVGSPKEVYYVF